ncbi:MAG TPA: ATP-dependent DNA helicase RecG [Pirellulaceae bacterium]|jgi:ATP-dependent DNA helicase RecG|nr:ATP-dependent DNA helicase RecG [Pirellulaceae bacterium]
MATRDDWSARRTVVDDLVYLKSHVRDALKRLGLNTAADIVFRFPRTYRKFGEPVAIDALVDGEPAAIVGTIVEAESRRTRRGISQVGAVVRADGGEVRAVWFHQPFVLERLKPGRRVFLSGVFKKKGGVFETGQPKWRLLADDETNPSGGIEPIYRLTEGVSQNELRQAIWKTVDRFADGAEEILPESFRTSNDVLDLPTALRQIHAPKSDRELAAARERFSFQELLTLQLAAGMRRRDRLHKRLAPSMPLTEEIDRRIQGRLPFEPTGEQRKAMMEVASDLGRTRPMNRLLQGDVGSGKTLVAAYAALQTVAYKCQAAIVAPTEILARQHFDRFSHLLEGSRVRIALFAGTRPSVERKTQLEALAAGEIDLVIGTQSVLGESVEFSALGLLVIDEQHRFSVKQRAGHAPNGARNSPNGAGNSSNGALEQREEFAEPHRLLLSATPIPRTLSLAYLGDLDLSTLREAPPGRKPIRTYLAEEKQRPKWYEFLAKKLKEGRQAYVITPAVEGNEELKILGVAGELERIQTALPGVRAAALHGGMDSVEKETVLKAFERGQTRVLVATTVVEVGIDVPNATLITIEHADRFGVAQLHQLRGRIGRGAYPGYATLFSETTSDLARKRLETFSKTTDGFELAEADMKLRGPGDWFGSRQHGMPTFRVADLSRDRDLLEAARDAAGEILEEDPDLTSPDWAALGDRVRRRYGEVYELGDVG